MSDAKPWLRPSALPKLALCAHYRSDPVSGPAAERGTKIDVAFRQILEGIEPDLSGWEELDVTALTWAVETAKALAGGAYLESREEHLKTGALGLEGTADLLCESACWSADLKTGQIRGYDQQQALYALGFMDDYFRDEWTVYLIYCDQEQVERLHFTRDEAEAVVRGVLAKVNDPQSPPTLNDYCGWCASRWTCTARREALGIAPFDPTTDDVITIKGATSEQLASFARRAKIVEEFDDVVRAELLTRCMAGEKIPGVSRTSKKGARVLDLSEISTKDFAKLEAHELLEHVEKLQDLLGNVSEDKARASWPRGIQFPDEKVKQAPGSTFVTVRRPKEVSK